MERLSSSIHTIHRPLARLNRRNIPILLKPPLKRNEEDLLEDVSTSDDENENDFEASMSPPAHSSRISFKDGLPQNPFEAMRERTGSMATIRLHRRTRLAEKLKEVYDLEDVREVWAGMSSIVYYFVRSSDIIFQKCPVGFCVLSVSSVRVIRLCSLNEMTASLAGLHVSHELLPVFFRSYAFKRGKFYLSISSEDGYIDGNILQDQVLKSGSLNKKAQRTKRWIKHWFVLKNDALSWYQSSSVRLSTFFLQAPFVTMPAGSIFPPWNCRLAVHYILRSCG